MGGDDVWLELRFRLTELRGSLQVNRCKMITGVQQRTTWSGLSRSELPSQSSLENYVSALLLAQPVRAVHIVTQLSRATHILLLVVD